MTSTLSEIHPSCCLFPQHTHTHTHTQPLDAHKGHHGSHHIYGSKSCYHERVLGDKLVPGEQEVDVAVDSVVVVQELLLVGADEAPELAALHVHVEERNRVLVEGRDGALGPQPVVRPWSNVFLRHEAREERSRVCEHVLKVLAAEEVVVCRDVVIVALAAVEHHVDVVSKLDVFPELVLVDLKVRVRLTAHLDIDHVLPEPLLELLGRPSVLGEDLPLLGDEVREDDGDALLEVAVKELLGRDGRAPLDAVPLDADPPGEDVGAALGAGLVAAHAWGSDDEGHRRWGGEGSHCSPHMVSSTGVVIKREGAKGGGGG